MVGSERQKGEAAEPPTLTTGRSAPGRLRRDADRRGGARIIRENVHRSPMYWADRIAEAALCQSIEDKIVRLGNGGHQIFLTGGADDDTVIEGDSRPCRGRPRGFGPFIPGLERATIVARARPSSRPRRAAGAQLLGSRRAPGLFLDGQINGTRAMRKRGGAGPGAVQSARGREVDRTSLLTSQ